MTAFEWSLLLVLSFLWGGSFFFVGVAVKELPPLTIVVLRVALAALMLHFVIRIMGMHLPRTREAWFAFFGMGLLNNAIPFGLIVWGQTHIASGVASILNATTPLFTVIVAHYLTADEKMSGGRLFGVMAGFTGVAIMIGGTALDALGIGVVAQLGILVAALSYAFAGVFGRRFRKMGIAPLATATGQVTASSLMLLPLMLIIDRPWTLSWPSANVVAAVTGLALLSTALAYILYFRILATAGATNLALVTFLIPASAILLGVLVLGEKLQSRHAVGLGLIAIGLAAVDGRVWRVFKRKSAPA
ncbi:EamA family transporter [Phyllobacterium phragmitis]|uniref:EamA family transporter n=2 Tax=Phyllobacterium phragmitis TaxID=2670329 RepID=A0A2S9IKJ2_9HYPH|nr:EamA family transporter [Phyllobacterium phragmitis]